MSKNNGRYTQQHYGGRGGFCHTSPHEALIIGKAHIFGSREAAVVEHSPKWGLIVRLIAGGVHTSSTPLITGNKEAHSLLKPTIFNVKTPPIIHVQWEDFDRPPLTKQWWTELHTTIRGWKHRKDIVFYCQGGHGRTGTALSILAGLEAKLRGTKDFDPVAFIRKTYCTSAVESTEQLDYIEDITGYKIDSEPAFGGWHWSNDRKYDGVYSATTYKPKEADAGLGKEPSERKDEKSGTKFSLADDDIVEYIDGKVYVNGEELDAEHHAALADALIDNDTHILTPETGDDGSWEGPHHRQSGA